MENKDIKDILNKVESGEFNSQEEQIAKLWLFRLNTKNRAELSESQLDFASESIWQRLNGVKRSKPRRAKLWVQIASAAATVAFILIGLYFFNGYNRKPDLVSAHDVIPGKSSATLTLSNGKKIKLSDAANGELANEAGVVITKSANGQLIYQTNEAGTTNKVNILSTEKGETYQVRLPDNSLVFLNAASSLTYSPNLIKNGHRFVKLSGEGYFEIAKDKAHPFVVQSNGQDVEVLGTHFNINAYTDEPAIATTLLEGSVKITTADKVQMLIPGQQAMNNGNIISVKQVNSESITDWKNGDFYLERVSFKTAMRKIARWYDMEIQYDATITDDIQSGGWVSRSNKLSKVLEALERTGLARFKVEGRKIYVYK